MSLDALVLFFIFGACLQLLKVNFSFPQGLSKSLMLILLIAIGIKGGLSLKDYANVSLMIQVAVVAMIGVLLPLIAFPLLRYFGEMNTTNAASIAAHYGSVSVGTFAVAIAFVESLSIPYEQYFALFVVVLEVPAIIVGLFLAHRNLQSESLSQSKPLSLSKMLHEILFNPGVVFLVGGLLIGYFSNSSISGVLPLFKELFAGVLALFLLEMGMIASERVKSILSNGLFIIAFAIFMPLVGSVIGAVTGHFLLGFSVGGVTLLAVLAASASYIAVPAAMRQALPEANHSLSIAASLGVSFPFNVLVGIPLYLVLAQWLSHF